MRSLCIQPRTPSFSTISRYSLPSPPSVPPPPSPSSSADACCFEEAQALIQKWDSATSSFAAVTSLFHHDKTEARQYIRHVNQLHQLMHSLDTHTLVKAQNLMQMAMKRLQKEFYQILSMNREHLDPESVSVRSSRTSISTSDYDETDDGSPEHEIQEEGDSISDVGSVSFVAMENLRSIAECMISCGYTKECLRVYVSIRKSIISEGVYRLNVDKLSSSKIYKMDWEALELKIKSWLGAVNISVRTLFNGERILCDHVFGSSQSIRESCFFEISSDGATCLFRLPELLAKTKKSPPEKIFRMLDMYSALSALWPEIELIFSFDSTSAIRAQVLTSLVQLSESVRTMFLEFESTIKKHSSRSSVSDGGVHPLTIQAMSHLSLLADYDSTLSDMFVDWPLQPNSPSPSLMESSRDTSDSENSSAPPLSFSARISRMILVLLCKLDGKAAHYKDASLGYLFLANNVHHVINRVRNSNLQVVLGYEWMEKYEAKMKWFLTNYEKVAWGDVISSLPENPKGPISTTEAKQIFEKFNFYFEKGYRKQNSFVVADRTLKEEITGSIARKVVPVYREFYDTHKILVGSWREMREYVQFTPEDVASYVSNLFFARTTPCC